MDVSFEIPTNQMIVICAHCNHHERGKALIEFNAREQKILFLCVNCKKMNEIKFGPAPHEQGAPPMPKTRLGR